MTTLVIIIFILSLIGFITASVVIFYHVARYSLIGDLSKKVFVIYLIVGFSIIALSVISVVINHLVNEIA